MRISPMAVLFFTVLIDLIGFGIVIPILPFVVPQFGGTNADVFWITAVYSLGAAAATPFWGRMSDKFGRKPMLLVCLAGACVSYLALAVCTSLLALYAIRIFAGVMAGNFGVASAAMADITTSETRAKGMGMIGAAFGLGMTIGPGLGGILAGEEANFVMPSLVAAGLSFTAIIMGSIVLKESLTPEKRAENARYLKEAPVTVWEMLTQCGNRLLALQYLIMNSAISLMATMFPIWAGTILGWTPKEVGYTLVVQGLMMAAMQGALIAPLSKMLGEFRFLLIGMTTLIVGAIYASQAATTFTVVTSFFIALTGASFITPVMNSITSKRTPLHFRGRTLGVTTSMGALGRVVGPAIGAMITLYLEPAFMIAWIMAAVITLFGSVWVIKQYRQSGPWVADINEDEPVSNEEQGATA